MLCSLSVQAVTYSELLGKYWADMMLLLSLLSAGVSIVLAQPPNIIVILADDLGYNDVSWHNTAVLTPTLHS